MIVDKSYQGVVKQPHFDQIHKRYDLLNHILSFGRDHYWRRRMWSALNNDGNKGVILDLASGTGDSAKGLVQKGSLVIGADLSLQMLRTAVLKIASPNYHAIVANGYALPFRDDTFEGMTCAFGIRNMHDTRRALREIHRVLKPKGIAVFLEFSRPKGMFSPLYNVYLKHLLPKIASLFSSAEAYRYLAESIARFPDKEEFCSMLVESGFDSCDCMDMTFGIVTIYRAQLKNKPI